MLASQALLMAGVPLNRVIRQIQASRAHRYAVFSGYFRQTEHVDDNDHLQPRFLSVYLKKDHAAVGKALVEMALAELKVEVNAVRRHGIRGAQPSADTQLMAGDVLVLLGLPDALKAAQLRLHKGV